MVVLSYKGNPKLTLTQEKKKLQKSVAIRPSLGTWRKLVSWGRCAVTWIRMVTWRGKRKKWEVRVGYMGTREEKKAGVEVDSQVSV